MTTPTPSALDALAAELRSLAGCDARAGAPLGKAMEEAADLIESLSDRLAASERMTQSAQRVIDRLEAENTAAEAALKGAVDALEPTEEEFAIAIAAARTRARSASHEETQQRAASDYVRLEEACNLMGRITDRERDARATAAEAALQRAVEALTPSAETKAAYSGEFRFPVIDHDEDGNELTGHMIVPWTTIKEIMAAIRARGIAQNKGGSGDER